MLRPFLTLTIEYFLAILVLKRGKNYKNVITALLFFLASYQLGEFIVFAGNWNNMGLRIAYFSTTLLPPLGVLLVQQVTKKEYGYIFFQLIGAVFAVAFLLLPNLIVQYEVGTTCIRVIEYAKVINTYWQNYYGLTLTYSMIIIAYNYFKTEDIKLKDLLLKLFFGYVSFFVTSVLFVQMVPAYREYLASFMCALAVGVAVILSQISIENYKYSIKGAFHNLLSRFGD